MPDPVPESEDTGTHGTGDPRSGEPRQRARSSGMTPEQRRFLNPGRTTHRHTIEPEPTAPTPAPVAERKVGFKQIKSKPARALEMQTVALVGGALLLLGITFYVGKKYEYWKYEIASRKNTKILESEANKYPGVSAEELMDRALAAERAGAWQEAADRYIAAKFKNPSIPDLLFRAGKLYYDHAAFDSADKLFERAIALGENADAANYHRGMIAMGRDDFPAAERFFESASSAAPFNGDYLYSWAEALRKHLQPKTAIAYYQKAALRTSDSGATICRFKGRMAMVEAGDVDQVQQELEQEQSKGPLSVDWLMTAAALQIHAGDIDKAVRTVEQARGSDQSVSWGAFAACAGDRFFTNATRNHPELAKACKMSP